MGWIRVETCIDGTKHCFEIESDAWKLNFPSGILLDTPDKITQICISKERIVIRTEDPDFRNGNMLAPILKESRRINNINAYDHNGVHQWNIGDLVGDIHMQFDYVTHITAAEAKQLYGVKIHKTKHQLYSCIAEGFVYLIDANDKRLLYRISGEVK